MIRILVGDCRDVMRRLEPESVHCAVTSPPYYGLREYQIAPTLWGGDPSCDHEWGPAPRTAWANSVQGEKRGRGGKNVNYRNTAKETGPFCVRCGCWKGVLGMEVTYSCGQPFSETRPGLPPDLQRSIHQQFEDAGLLGVVFDGRGCRASRHSQDHSEAQDEVPTASCDGREASRRASRTPAPDMSSRPAPEPPDGTVCKQACTNLGPEPENDLRSMPGCPDRDDNCRSAASYSADGPERSPHDAQRTSDQSCDRSTLQRFFDASQEGKEARASSPSRDELRRSSRRHRDAAQDCRGDSPTSSDSSTSRTADRSRSRTRRTDRNDDGIFLPSCFVPPHLKTVFRSRLCGSCYVCHMVEVFREVRRVLRPDGTVWLNLGDSYATGAGAVGDHPGGGAQGAKWAGRPPAGATAWAGRGSGGDHRGRGTSSARPAMGKHAYMGGAIPGDERTRVGSNRAQRGDGNGGVPYGPMTQPNRLPQPGLKPKDQMMIPARVAIALCDDGWFLRQDIIWQKGTAMPESIQDRCTKSHEHIFLLAKAERYFFDADAIAEPVTQSTIDRLSQPSYEQQLGSFRVPGKSNGPLKAAIKRSSNKERRPASARGVPVDTQGKTSGAVAGSIPWEGTTRNKRDVWSVNPQAFRGEFCRACMTYFEGDALAALRTEVAEVAEETVEAAVHVGPRRERRRWCSCGRRDAWLSHFATFGFDLVAPMILAGTSGQGCCARCGAPWERVADKELVPTAKAAFAIIPNERDAAADDNDCGANWQKSGHRNWWSYKTTAVRWRPTCDCPDVEPARAVVLDPFGGSGTTAIAADRLGRDAVLVESNPLYAEMARQRAKLDGGFLCEVVLEDGAPREAAE